MTEITITAQIDDKDTINLYHKYNIEYFLFVSNAPDGHYEINGRHWAAVNGILGLYYGFDPKGGFEPAKIIPKLSDHETTFTWAVPSNDRHAVPRYRQIYKGLNFATDNFEMIIVVHPEENAIKLQNGTYLINDYGKYQSGLSIISAIPFIPYQAISTKELNLEYGDFEYIRGHFFISKKGTKCFKIDNLHGEDILLKDSWGGAFAKRRGSVLPNEDNGAKYYHVARSNGGGCENTYAVFPYGWTYTLSEDDI